MHEVVFSYESSEEDLEADPIVRARKMLRNYRPMVVHDVTACVQDIERIRLSEYERKLPESEDKERWDEFDRRLSAWRSQTVIQFVLHRAEWLV